MIEFLENFLEMLLRIDGRFGSSFSADLAVTCTFLILPWPVPWTPIADSAVLY